MKSTSMVATPLAKGLIRGAIMQSSGGLERTRNGMTTTLDIAEQNGVKMLESMGVHSIDCLLYTSLPEV